MSVSDILYPVKCFTAGTTKRLNMDALDNIIGIPALKVNVESVEEKPWRKAGKYWSADVDISL